MWLQKYAYVEDKWDTSWVSHGVKRLTAEDNKAQFWLNSWNFVSFLSHRSNPFSPEVIRSHISYLIDTTKKASKYIVTKSTINEIKNITNELIKTWESLTTLLTHYNKLRLLVPVEEESFKLRSTIREIGSDSGNKVWKRPTLEKYDKQRDYYESEDPATLPTHFHVSDEMLDVVHYKYDHQEN